MYARRQQTTSFDLRRVNMSKVERLRTISILLLGLWLPAAAVGQQKRSPVAPGRERVEVVVREAYDKFRSDTSGKNADYIPYLAQVDPKLFGVSIVTTDNQVLNVGDVNYAFSIQSISKVFTLALAMEELGPDKVYQRIGSEPTGRAFNSVVAVVDMPTHTGNPLVNAGAIATTSLISGKDADEKWNKVLAFYSKAAGEKLALIDGSINPRAPRMQAIKPCQCCSRSTSVSMPIRLSPSIFTPN